jgi:hypothetical protein
MVSPGGYIDTEESGCQRPVIVDRHVKLQLFWMWRRDAKEGAIDARVACHLHLTSKERVSGLWQAEIPPSSEPEGYPQGRVKTDSGIIHAKNMPLYSPKEQEHTEGALLHGYAARPSSLRTSPVQHAHRNTLSFGVLKPLYFLKMRAVWPLCSECVHSKTTVRSEG